jgi:hypothetical protein
MLVNELCTWCGAEVEPDEGFRAFEPAGERRAVFCRLEHVIPWAIQGAHWDAAEMGEAPSLEEGLSTCSHCGAELGDARVLLVRHRGEHRIPDAFCSVDHLTDWAKAGGRWQ